jgi:hypothetical protein
MWSKINVITATAVKQINNNNNNKLFLLLENVSRVPNFMFKISSHPFSKQLVHLPSIMWPAAWKIHAMHLQPNVTGLFQEPFINSKKILYILICETTLPMWYMNVILPLCDAQHILQPVIHLYHPYFSSCEWGWQEVGFYCTWLNDWEGGWLKTWTTLRNFRELL